MNVYMNVYICIYKITINGKVDKSNIYNGFSSNIGLVYKKKD